LIATQKQLAAAGPVGSRPQVVVFGM
jgi:hypothetical protein